MIPTIEDIVDMVRHAQCERSQAIAWLEQHVEMARERADLEDLRDHFAAQAITAASGLYAGPDSLARHCYEVADAMLKAREA